MLAARQHQWVHTVGTAQELLNGLHEAAIQGLPAARTCSTCSTQKDATAAAPVSGVEQNPFDSTWTCSDTRCYSNKFLASQLISKHDAPNNIPLRAVGELSAHRALNSSQVPAQGLDADGSQNAVGFCTSVSLCRLHLLIWVSGKQHRRTGGLCLTLTCRDEREP